MTNKIKFWFLLCAGIFSVFFIVSSCSDKDEILPDDDTPGMVKDIEGNEYRTVKIGDQIWMAENLRTTKYNNGSPILNLTNNEDWDESTDGAYVWYNNDAELYKTTYGGMYNFYAIETEKLCPVGWRVPNENDWYQLREYLINEENLENAVFGGLDGLGNALKSCRQVDSPLGGECNTTQHPYWAEHTINYGFDLFEFSALAGGYRKEGQFFKLGSVGIYWTSTEGSLGGIYFSFEYNRGDISRYSAIKNEGFSVRCIRD